MDFKRRFLTANELRTEQKQQLNQWIVAGGSALKKAKTVGSAGKVMATVF